MAICRRRIAIELGEGRSGRARRAARSEVLRLAQAPGNNVSLRGNRTLLADQESTCGDGEGRVVMETAPTAPLVVAEPDLLLEIGGNRAQFPRVLGQRDQFLERRGSWLVAKIPHGHWKTMTFLAALRHDRIAAPFVIDDLIDGDSFGDYVTHCLAPTPAPG